MVVEKVGLKMPDGKWKGVLSRIVPGGKDCPWGPLGVLFDAPQCDPVVLSHPAQEDLSAAVLCLRPAALPWAKNIFAQGTGQGGASGTNTGPE